MRLIFSMTSLCTSNHPLFKALQPFSVHNIVKIRSKDRLGKRLTMLCALCSFLTVVPSLSVAQEWEQFDSDDSQFEQVLGFHSLSTPSSSHVLASYAQLLLGGSSTLNVEVKMRQTFNASCVEDIQTYARLPFADPNCQNSTVPTMVVTDVLPTSFFESTSQATMKMLNVTRVDRLMRWMGVGAGALNNPEALAEGLTMTFQPGIHSSWISLNYCY